MDCFNAFVLSLFITIALVPMVKTMAFRFNIVDLPNTRKIHSLPMPKSGGISMAAGVFIPVMLCVSQSRLMSSILIGASVIVLFGLMDDIREMDYKQKFLGQTIAALVVILHGGVQIRCLGDLLPYNYVMPDMLCIGLTLIVIIGVTNAINLSDGLDGLAGGISMLSFIVMGFLALRCGNMLIAVMCAAVTGAILGFLRYNTHPAVLFMGDAGSQMLGFLAITFAVVLTQSNTPYSRLLPLLIIGFPILDTLFVMVERIVRGRSPFKADKNHFHHKLIQLGLFHSETVPVIYALQTLFLSFAFIFTFYSDWVHLLFLLMVSGCLFTGFRLADLYGWKLRSATEANQELKTGISALLGKKIGIAFSFNTIKLGIPLLFLLLCFLPGQIPWYCSVQALISMVFFAFFRLFKKKLPAPAMKISLFLMIPMLLYSLSTNPASWVTDILLAWLYLLFSIMIALVIVTLNLTRRKSGVQLTGLDFLVFIVILILPNLPTSHLDSSGMVTVIGNSLMLFYSYDILFGELRGENGFLEIATLFSYAVIAARGVLGW